MLFDVNLGELTCLACFALAKAGSSGMMKEPSANASSRLYCSSCLSQWSSSLRALAAFRQRADLGYSLWMMKT